MSRFAAYLALSTARDKLRTLPEHDLEEFADVLALLEAAIPASKEPESAEDALELCKRAFDCFDEGIAARQNAAGIRLPPIISEAVQIVRGALYYAAVDLRSALAESMNTKRRRFLRDPAPPAHALNASRHRVSPR